MSDEALPRRTYSAPGRVAAARATRRRICAAAARLFLANGYAATSVRAIAQAAEVAEKTVYLQFATKSMLLKEVVETAIVGDDEPIPAAGRDWFQQILAEPEPAGKLGLLTEHASALHERTGALFAMARGAAAVDAEAAALWNAGKQGHRADMALLARNFVDAGMAGAGLDLGWATSVLYVLVGPETWHLVRVELELDAQGYRDWLLASLARAFVPAAR